MIDINLFRHNINEVIDNLKKRCVLKNILEDVYKIHQLDILNRENNSNLDSLRRKKNKIVNDLHLSIDDNKLK
jgi:seryl-tRNA synthetase